jgi:hypothetical protein
MSVQTMTAARQPEKWLPLLILLAVLVGISPKGLQAEPALVVNAATGLAISGFDPVAYFTDGTPQIGRPEFEANLDGAIWRFRNSGNRAAFVSRPDAYRPRFGGYDPVAIARGRAVAGHPLFWAAAGERLYLFYSAANRDAFIANPRATIAAAERKWPQVKRLAAR